MSKLCDWYSCKGPPQSQHTGVADSANDALETLSGLLRTTSKSRPVPSNPNQSSRAISASSAPDSGEHRKKTDNGAQRTRRKEAHRRINHPKHNLDVDLDNEYMTDVENERG